MCLGLILSHNLHLQTSAHSQRTATTSTTSSSAAAATAANTSHTSVTSIASTSSVDVTAADDDARCSTSSPGGQAAFLHKVRQASEAVSAGDFRRAVQAYGQAIALDPSNHILYTNRSAALFKLSRFADSVKDARAARDLNPKWAKVSDAPLSLSLSLCPSPWVCFLSVPPYSPPPLLSLSLSVAQFMP